MDRQTATNCCCFSYATIISINSHVAATATALAATLPFILHDLENNNEIIIILRWKLRSLTQIYDKLQPFMPVSLPLPAYLQPAAILITASLTL